MRLVQLTAIAAVLAAAVAFAGVGRPDAAHGSAPDARSVTVSGTANVQAVPNKAEFSAGVSTNAATARRNRAQCPDRVSLTVAAQCHGRPP